MDYPKPDNVVASLGDAGLKKLACGPRCLVTGGALPADRDSRVLAS